MGGGRSDNLISIDGDHFERLRAMVLADNQLGFATYYTLASGMILPRHCWEWVGRIYEARAKGMGWALEAFRGSLKTSILTNFFTSYQIGLHPDLESIFVQAGEDSAHDNAKFVAGLIASNPAFRLFFPDIMPDEDAGWGESGYEVKRIGMDYGRWRQLRTKDPTLIGDGIGSQNIIGRHPRLFLILDDLNNHRNTKSQRELASVLDSLHKDVLPGLMPETWVGYNFTPWVIGDVGTEARANPNLAHIRTPLCDPDLENCVWPEKWSKETLIKFRDGMPPAEWAQMYLLDTEAAQGKFLRKEWLSYMPISEVGRDWRRVLGVDYASVPNHASHVGHSRYALAVWAVRPSGKGMVLVDGYVGHLTQTEGEDKLVGFLQLLGKLVIRVGVEAIGRGEEFFHRMLKRVAVNLMKITGNKSKGDKFEKGLAPAFAQGLLMLADDPGNEFLKQFENEWLAWDRSESYTNDCLDAGYMGAVAGKVFLTPGLEDPNEGLDLLSRRRKEREKVIANPMFGFGRR